MANELKTASVLAFERKLDPSDALLHAGKWENRENDSAWAPVTLREKSVRGTMSSRKQAKDVDALKLDGNEKNPNLQTVDVATLPADADTLKVQFSLRVLGGAGTPSACNDDAYRAKLLATVDGYVQQHGFAELARRYAANLANARFLWRNRIGAEQVNVRVAQLREGQPVATWQFDALQYPLRNLSAPPAEAKALAELAEVIAAGLTGNAHVLLQVTAFVRVGAGQEVFPSQELILDRGRGDKSKTLYHVDNTAAIHSQKIGNALRTIDTWYEGAADNGPIAVEPYGSVTTQGKAWRQPKQKQDFYNLLDGWVLKDKVPDTDQQHFVIATLVRGGVFGESDK
ncbi:MULTISPECIES: type I-F CRISPR-associated protein Csy3 [Pseudomonadota]|uniref:type I-F CRISPR-associated protein Csy3 n=1 Tax=Pseudomonadota TaxID=1224 RepID=UPI00262DC269|nr:MULTISPECIES: type I-F CRISPR-associated protein Csy3 [Pseudomonadota]